MLSLCLSLCLAQPPPLPPPVPFLPPIIATDLDRFPDKDFTREQWYWSQAHLEMSREQFAMAPHVWQLRNLILDLECRERIWWNLKEAHSYRVRNNPSDVLDHLTALRDLLGPDAYYQGQMPCAVPWWTFRELTHTPWQLDPPPPITQPEMEPLSP